jgi:hypothetical protein
MIALKELFADNEKIEYRYLTYPKVARLESICKNILDGNMSEKKSYYAFVNEKVRLPFAAFMVFDKKHVFIRAPYESGKKEPYLLISNRLISEMFCHWHDMIWKEAEEVSDDSIDMLQRKIVEVRK